MRMGLGDYWRAVKGEGVVRLDQYPRNGGTERTYFIQAVEEVR